MDAITLAVAHRLLGITEADLVDDELQLLYRDRDGRVCTVPAYLTDLAATEQMAAWLVRERGAFVVMRNADGYLITGGSFQPTFALALAHAIIS